MSLYIVFLFPVRKSSRVTLFGWVASRDNIYIACNWSVSSRWTRAVITPNVLSVLPPSTNRTTPRPFLDGGEQAARLGCGEAIRNTTTQNTQNTTLWFGIWRSSSMSTFSVFWELFREAEESLWRRSRKLNQKWAARSASGPEPGGWLAPHVMWLLEETGSMLVRTINPLGWQPLILIMSTPTCVMTSSIP